MGITPAELAVVANSYLIALAGLVLLGGHLADVLGGRRIFLIGMSAYVAASAVCALAVDVNMLIAGRIGQGIGAALTIPAALALVLAIYTAPGERTKALGTWGAVAGTGSLVGVFAGGTLTQLLGWQSVFWAPVPLGIAAALLVWRTIPPLPGRPGRFDLTGAISITVGIGTLALGSVNAAEIGWTSPSTLISLAIGVAALATFVIAEHRTPHPLIPLAVFRRRAVSTSTGVMVLIGGCLTSLFFFLPLYQQEELGMGALETGLTQIPLAVIIIVGSILAPLLSEHLGLSQALPLSLLELIVGLLAIAIIPATAFSWQHLVAFLVVGLGLGLGLVTATTMAVRDSAVGESGLLGGLVNAAQHLGGALGLAVLAGIALTAGAAGSISFLAAFLAMAGLIALAILLSGLSAIHSRGLRVAAT